MAEITSRQINHTTGVISLTIDNEPHIIHSSHPNYDAVKDALGKNDGDTIVNLVDIPKSFNKLTNGKVTITGDQVLYLDRVVGDVIAERILELHRANYNIDYMCNFLDRLYQNPSRRALKELFPFLEHRNLQITNDGCFYAYKAIRSNWTDKHTGTIDFSIGKVVEMPRNEVNEDYGTDCAEGLHVGNAQYVNNFGSRGNGDHFVLVKVDPKDVVCCPSAADKCRVCKLEVIREATEEEIREGLGIGVYDATGHNIGTINDELNSVNEDNNDDDDWVGFDEHDDDEYEDDFDEDDGYDDPYTGGSY